MIKKITRLKADRIFHHGRQRAKALVNDAVDLENRHLENQVEDHGGHEVAIRRGISPAAILSAMVCLSTLTWLGMSGVILRM